MKIQKKYAWLNTLGIEHGACGWRNRFSKNNHFAQVCLSTWEWLSGEHNNRIYSLSASFPTNKQAKVFQTWIFFFKCGMKNGERCLNYNNYSVHLKMWRWFRFWKCLYVFLLLIDVSYKVCLLLNTVHCSSNIKTWNMRYGKNGIINERNDVPSTESIFINRRQLVSSWEVWKWFIIWHLFCIVHTIKRKLQRIHANGWRRRCLLIMVNYNMKQFVLFHYYYYYHRLQWFAFFMSNKKNNCIILCLQFLHHKLWTIYYVVFSCHIVFSFRVSFETEDEKQQTPTANSNCSKKTKIEKSQRRSLTCRWHNKFSFKC